MNTRFHKLAATCSLSLLSFAGLHAAAVTWGAAETNFIADASGTPLAVGDLVEVGSFGSLTPSQISSASLSTLEANFTAFGTGAIGDAELVSGGSSPTSVDDGTWLDTTTNSTAGLGIAGSAIYYWDFNAATIGAATQEGVFTGAFNGSNTSQWFFPADSAVPNSVTTDLSDVPTSGILIGSYGTGSYLGGQLYNLAPIAVPEPSAATFALLAGLGLIGMRFFLKRQEAKLA